MADIEERLRSHAQAFDGLLSLIPAKFYYGEDSSDQWKKTKQTKEQAREAKRAKLDPDSAKTAKDVMDENARKRKREEEQQDGAESSDDGDLGSEIPREGLKRADTSKKQKQAQTPTTTDGSADPKAEEAEARKKLKEDKKAQKKQNQKEKKKAKEAARKAKEEDKRAEEAKNSAPDAAETSKVDEQAQSSEDEDAEEVDGDEAPVTEGLSLEFNEEDHSLSSAPESPGFDNSNPQSGSSSISSIVPPSAASDATKTSNSEPKPLKSTPEELKQRLQKRLDELRAARHADGLDGKPARNRQELIEARRQKAEQRKTHKKLLRQKAREEEQRVKDEAMTRRFSPGGSGSLLASPRSPADSVGSGSYAFGRVVFSDGQMADASLSNVREKPKTNGPRDPASALKAAEAKQARLAVMDEEKRADIEEKDMWLNAKKRAHGERVRDDTSLLKKALKRKESAKKRSEREWKDRIDTVKKGKDMKQQKREENLRKRREEKGNKGGGKKAGGGKGKPRPGFEGSFKAKVGGAKKK
ncbi:surfeit locus protein 6-domain-containing protein [Aspergillus pseudoustus]|uniref:Surfeit locus protein 6-domain-containing protein n=1 Tax=Aspergillus pseudoustus TaxID=1810923 RepID=A0ABR4KZZ6_9EURO